LNKQAHSNAKDDLADLPDLMYRNFRITRRDEDKSDFDWMHLRQGDHEDVHHFFDRVHDAVSRFFRNNNGTTRPDVANPRLTDFALSPAAEEAIRSVSQKARVQLETMLREALARDSRVGPKTATAADDTNWDRYLAAIENTVWATVLRSVLVREAYEDLRHNTARALVLKTLHSGLKDQECKDEVFRHLKHPKLPFLHLVESLKKKEALLGKKMNKGTRQRSNPPKTFQAFTISTESQLKAFTDMVLAVAKYDNMYEPVQWQKSTDVHKKRGKFCFYCNRQGHNKQECRFLLQDIKSKQTSESNSPNVSSQR
jgi:prephenate dehydratase